MIIRAWKFKMLTTPNLRWLKGCDNYFRKKGMEADLFVEFDDPEAHPDKMPEAEFAMESFRCLCFERAQRDRLIDEAQWHSRAYDERFGFPEGPMSRSRNWFGPHDPSMVERLLNAAAEADERVRRAMMAHHLAVSFMDSPDVHENIKATRMWTASNLKDISLDYEHAMGQAGNRIADIGPDL